MKVLMINGSPKANGNTSIALREMEKVFTENGVETEYETTEISLEYIPQTDSISIKNGVRINGNEELNQYLENFE